MPLHILIEGLLFYKSAPVSHASLRKLFDVDETTLRNALDTLHESLSSRGIRLVETSTAVQLMTAPELSELLEALRKEELKADIGKAGAETLAIILYREPVSRAEIDRIRGVNSSFILRNLMTRGLISRNKRGTGYDFSVTPELLAHLGVESKQALSDFASVMDALDAFEASGVKQT